MATTAKKTAKPSAKNEIAVRKTTAVGSTINIKEQLAAMMAKQSGMTGAASGIKVRITQDKQFALPDGTKTREPLELIVLGFNSRNDFYESDFDKDNIVPPTCFAIGDIPTQLVPSPNSPEKQSTACAGCPMNEFGSKGKGKACKNSRVLAVMRPGVHLDDNGERVDQPIWLLQVSPTAVKVWDSYVKEVQRNFNAPPLCVITTVDFADSDYPTVEFTNAAPHDDLEYAFSRAEEAAQLLAQEPDVSSYVKADARAKPKGVVKRPVSSVRR